jgi:GT2 family glycosyltransferase
MSSTPVGAGAPRVSAVIVSHDGERWIPHLISALEASTCVPDAVVAVDTGSTDRSRDLLGAALGGSEVIDAPRDAGFGCAVQRGLDALDARRPADSANEWVWLLHDDCAPAPDALEQLLLLVQEYPDASIVGCRVRAWPRARRLLEVGVTTTGTGRRETGLEPGEYDQGQHDGVRRVLAVSSAGMLVRRSVWDELGGFDRRLPLFRDDLDFGWRAARAGRAVVVSPEAVVFHAEAATRGVRAIDNTLPSPHRADRAAALYTLLVNCSLLALPFQYLRLAVGSVLRSIGYLVGKLPSAAYDEVAAAARVLSRPDVVARGRSMRRRTRAAPSSDVRALLPGWWTPYANGLDALLSRFAESFRESAAAVADSAARTLRRRGGADVGAIETGPASDEASDIPWGAGPVAWVVRHPVLSMSAALAALALVAGRGLFGSGTLHGGALLPAPDGASAWWGLYTEQWHPVALGSGQAASPYVLMLGVLGGVLLGKAWLAVDLLVLMAVPLAAWGAHSLARRLFASRGAQAWVAVSYGLLPVVTGAFASGRVGTVAAAVLLPWLVRLALPLLAGSGNPWRPAFGAGLALAATGAFCPIAWAIAAAVAVPGAALLATRRRYAAIAGLVAALVVPIAALLPWSFRVIAHPSLLLTEAGAIDPSTAALGADAWQALFGRLSAAGDAPWWIAVGIVLAAVAAVLRTDRRAAVAAAWTVAAASLAVAAIAAQHTVSTPGSNVESAAWLGFPVIVAQAALIVAGALAADGATEFIQSGRFGWRQPLALVTSVLAIAAPLAGLVWWVGAAPHGELARTTDSTLPAYILDQLRSGDQQRALLLTGDTQHISYDVVMDDGARLGDDSVDSEYGAPALDGIVADAVSEGRASDTARLADFGIGFVMIPAPADPGLVAALDGLPGLTKASTDPSSVVGWQFDQPTGFARLHDPGDPQSGETLSTSSGSGSANVGSGADGRTLDLAAASGKGFAASLDGRRLSPEVTEAGVRFAVGADGGRLEFGPTGHRGWWLALQALVVLVCVVLAAPAARRRQGIAEVSE